MIQRPHFLTLSSSFDARMGFHTDPARQRRNILAVAGDTSLCSLLGGLFLQLCLFRLVEGTLKGATVTSHVRSHSCTWSPGDMGTFLHPSRMGPARMSLGLSDLLFVGMMCLSGGPGGLLALEICVAKSGKVTTHVVSPVSRGISLSRIPLPSPRYLVFLQESSVSTCLLCISDAHYSREPLH